MDKGIANSQLLKCKADTLSENEAAEVLEYIGIMESLRVEAADPLAETLAKLLCEAMVGASEFERDQIRRRAIKN
jgi:hypothetical protein